MARSLAASADAARFTAAPAGRERRLRRFLIPASVAAGAAGPLAARGHARGQPAADAGPGRGAGQDRRRHRHRRAALEPRDHAAAGGGQLRHRHDASAWRWASSMGRVRLADELGQPWLVFFLNLPALVTIVLGLHLDRAGRERRHPRRGAEQDPQRRGDHPRGRARARSGPARDGAGVPGSAPAPSARTSCCRSSIPTSPAPPAPGSP